MFNFRHLPSHQSGFTLVEAMVAITILLIGVVGPLSILGRGIADGLFARNQIAANFLAQEALELITNFNQNNIFAGKSGFDGFDCDTDDGCDINIDNLTFSDCDASPCSYELNGINFGRKIFIEMVGTHQAKVRVQVDWYNRLASRSLILQTYLYK